MSDTAIENTRRDLVNEANRRLRIASIPAQIRDTIREARTGGEIPDATIREIFEDAMNANID